MKIVKVNEGTYTAVNKEKEVVGTFEKFKDYYQGKVVTGAKIKASNLTALKSLVERAMK